MEQKDGKGLHGGLIIPDCVLPHYSLSDQDYVKHTRLDISLDERSDCNEEKFAAFKKSYGDVDVELEFYGRL